MFVEVKTQNSTVRIYRDGKVARKMKHKRRWHYLKEAQSIGRRKRGKQTHLSLVKKAN